LHHCNRGELLPHLFTFSSASQGSLFSAALAVLKQLLVAALPVKKYDALCCPDFPLFK